MVDLCWLPVPRQLGMKLSAVFTALPTNPLSCNDVRVL